MEPAASRPSMVMQHNIRSTESHENFDVVVERSACRSTNNADAACPFCKWTSMDSYSALHPSLTFGTQPGRGNIISKAGQK
jgi:hypothetical protein